LAERLFPVLEPNPNLRKSNEHRGIIAAERRGRLAKRRLSAQAAAPRNQLGQDVQRHVWLTTSFDRITHPVTGRPDSLCRSFRRRFLRWLFERTAGIRSVQCVKQFAHD
jgi:hypothetical protein